MFNLVIFLKCHMSGRLPSNVSNEFFFQIAVTQKLLYKMFDVSRQFSGQPESHGQQVYTARQHIEVYLHVE